MTLRRYGWMLILVVAVLGAAPTVRAQQQPPAEEEEALPDRIIKGIFRALFGSGDSKKPDQPGSQPAPASAPAAPSAPATAPNPPEQAARPAPAPAPAAASQAQPVTASPSASAAPLSLHSAIAKGDYGNAMKMVEQGADIEAKDPGAGASALHYAVMKGYC